LVLLAGSDHRRVVIAPEDLEQALKRDEVLVERDLVRVRVRVRVRVTLTLTLTLTLRRG